MCVCMCEGATLQYRRKGRDSGGAYGYTAKNSYPSPPTALAVGGRDVAV